MQQIIWDKLSLLLYLLTFKFTKSISKELKKYPQNYFYYAKMPLFCDYTIPIMQARKNLKHVITFSEQVQ